MAYQPMVLDPSTPATVTRLVGLLERVSFRDVHTILRLPMAASTLGAACNFAIAHVLLATIGGISTTMYRSGKTDGERFKSLLRDHYPWNREPTHDVTPAEAARMIYEVFRNPLTHNLGLDLFGKSQGAKLVVKRLRSGSDGDGMSEQWIERLEAGPGRPRMSSTVTVRPDGARVLLVEALYWGVRRMVESMAREAHLMKKAENFLANKI